MKERFRKCNDDAHYVHEIKKYWWSKWKIECINNRPRLYINPSGNLVAVDEWVNSDGLEDYRLLMEICHDVVSEYENHSLGDSTIKELKTKLVNIPHY